MQLNPFKNANTTTAQPLRSSAEEGAAAQRMQAAFDAAQAAFDANPSDDNWHAKETARKNHEQAQARLANAKDRETAAARAVLKGQLDEQVEIASGLRKTLEPTVREMGDLLVKMMRLKRRVDDEADRAHRAHDAAGRLARQLDVPLSCAEPPLAEHETRAAFSEAFGEALQSDRVLEHVARGFVAWLPNDFR